MLAETSKKIKRVAFFGDADAGKSDEHYKDAKNTARLLAENGYIIVNGGGPGVMLAATLGAKEANGKVEIVVLDPKKQPKNYEGIDEGNLKLADEKYYTNDYPERLNKLIDLADAYVIFKGGTGTLSEMGLCWENAKFEYGNHEPLIFFGDFWKKIIDFLIKGLNLEKMEQRVVEVVERPEEVLRVLKRVGG